MKNTPFDLSGKVAVITGSSRGIGRSSAELLAKLGAKVVVSSRKAEACEEVGERHPQGRRRCPRHCLQHLAPRGGRGADCGRDRPLRQDRHPGLQCRHQSLLRPAARHQGRGLRQDHGLQRQEQHLALPAGDSGDGRARQGFGGHHLLDRRPARLDRDRRLRNFQGGGFRVVPQPRRRMGPEGRARQLRRARPRQDRFRPRAVGRRRAPETPLRHHADCAGSASPTRSPARWPISAPTPRAS